MALDGSAFVIGGGSGIGKATAIAFAKEGAKGLLVADLDLDAATKVAEESKVVATHPGFIVKAIQIDVALPGSVKDATSTMVKSFGRIDYCVNGAGITSPLPTPITKIEYEQFRKVQDVNVNGTFLVLNTVSAAMATQEPRVNDINQPQRGTSRGSIVNVASILSFKALSLTASYTTSKHAVLGLTRAAALDNTQNGIRVNCVCPSWVDTPMTQRACDSTPGFDRLVRSQLPLGRMGTPEEIADAILFLSSSKASFITGNLATFAVTSECQGRGIGSQLLEYCLEISDMARLPCWLIVFPASYQLYLRFGFEKVDHRDIDLNHWDSYKLRGYGIYHNYAMVRRPR
ncbi:hypothetical protein JX265_003520 [Neoarthrinium moseri]|uniref:N-acetyltransferase domain-containing protein n=1 Tax=Neoarthrinium moseri TaxID=1658444 RepID=A0A9P9WS00_9PEZI|nr:hypothetical protein JX265_003520 [Neoarthrinium moseri]